MAALHAKRRASVASTLLRVTVLAAILAVVAIGWHYATQILGPDAPPSYATENVFAISDTSVTLTADADTRAPGVQVLEWRGGFGELTDRLGEAGARITRRFRLRWGAPPRIGRAEVEPYAFVADPRTSLDLDYREVKIAAPLGDCPAWRIEPTDSLLAIGVASGEVSARAAVTSADWMIYVHGRGAARAQSLGVTPFFLRLGWTCLAITYRGDPEAPHKGRGRYRLGATEWRDLEAAVRYALANGAQRVIVIGNSMGGTIALQFLRHSPLAPRVNGVVLEGPVLRWGPVFDLAARERGAPAAITGFAMWIAAKRASIRWDDLDEIAHASDFRTPMLVFHGTADATVPPALSESLAVRRPDLVTLVRVMGAGHARCWNADPLGYEAAMASWLRRRLESAGGGAAPTVAAPAR